MTLLRMKDQRPSRDDVARAVAQALNNEKITRMRFEAFVESGFWNRVRWLILGQMPETYMVQEKEVDKDAL